MNCIIFSLEAPVCSETYKVENRKPPWIEHILQKVFGFLNEFLSSGSLLHLYFKNSKPKAALLLQVDSSFITSCSKICEPVPKLQTKVKLQNTKDLYIFLFDMVSFMVYIPIYTFRVVSLFFQICLTRLNYFNNILKI